MIELERKGTRGNPEQDTKIWLDKLAEVGRQRSGAQGLAVEGLLDHEELRAKLASLEETRKAAERELAVLGDHQEHLAKLERDKEAVLEYYSDIAPKALDSLAPKERRNLYGMLRMRAVVYPDGQVVAELGGPSGSFASAKESTCSSTCSGTKSAGLYSYARSDATTHGLIFRALLNNDGTREVRFERVEAG